MCAVGFALSYVVQVSPPLLASRFLPRLFYRVPPPCAEKKSGAPSKSRLVAGAAKSLNEKQEKRARRVIATRRTIAFGFSLCKVSGFATKPNTLLRTFCSPGWDTAAPVRHLDARLSGFWPRACALGPADWSGWQPAQVKERHGCPRHRRSHFGRCVRILPNSTDATQLGDEGRKDRNSPPPDSMRLRCGRNLLPH